MSWNRRKPSKQTLGIWRVSQPNCFLKIHQLSTKFCSCRKVNISNSSNTHLVYPHINPPPPLLSLSSPNQKPQNREWNQRKMEKKRFKNKIIHQITMLSIPKSVLNIFLQQTREASRLLLALLANSENTQQNSILLGLLNNDCTTICYPGKPLVKFT